MQLKAAFAAPGFSGSFCLLHRTAFDGFGTGEGSTGFCGMINLSIGSPKDRIRGRDRFRRHRRLGERRLRGKRRRGRRSRFPESRRRRKGSGSRGKRFLRLKDILIETGRRNGGRGDSGRGTGGKKQEQKEYTAENKVFFQGNHPFWQ